MTPETLLLQLESMRATGEALLAQVDAMKALLEGRAAPGPRGACDHPEDRRVAAAVMGHPDRFICGVCKATVDPEGD